MRDRTSIFEEWRALERQLDQVTDRQARTLLILRIEAIRAELAAATAARDEESDEREPLTPTST